MRALLRNRDYRLLLAANFVSSTGDWILSAGLAYQIYVLTGSTLASAATILAALLPQLAFGSFAGVLADRWDRRRTMIACNLLLTATLLPLLLITHAGQAPIVYAVAAGQSTLAALFTAAEAALVPALVTEPDAITDSGPEVAAEHAPFDAITGSRPEVPAEHTPLDAITDSRPEVPAEHALVTANALNGQVRDVARLAGAAAGGVLAAAGGIRLITLADMATFAAAAALLALIRHRAARRPRASARARHLLADWREGARIALSHRTLRTLLAFTLITGVGEAIMMTLMAPFVRDVLGGGAEAYGSIMAVQAVGGLLGGLLATLIGHRFPPRLLLGAGATVFGLLDLALFLYPLLTRAVWPALLIMVVVGLPGALSMAGLITVFQLATEDHHRARVFGAITALRAAAMLAGIALAGTLPARVGIVPVIALQGAGYCVGGLLALLTLPRPAAARLPKQRTTEAAVTAGRPENDCVPASDAISQTR